MPEGDTVWLAGRRMDDALRGHVIVASDFRVPALATVDLSGRKVLGVASRGKHLLTRFAPAGGDGGLTMHSHFRMDGTWHLYRPGETWRGGPEHQVRAVLRTEDRVLVGYRMPVLELIPTSEEESVVGHLGPDLCADECDLEAAVERLQRDSDEQIGVALLDQRNLAGLGTLYRSETLFLRGVSPFTPVGRVPNLPGVVSRARTLLMANRARPEQCTTGDLRQQHWVFERPGKPCRRCGGRIRHTTQGPHQRAVYWCPRCQPE